MAKLVITVDTEEEGLWGGKYPREGLSVRNVRGIPRFQEICEAVGVRPTYLVDAAIVQSDEAVTTLKPIADDGRCEIGTHVHPWCNPPMTEPSDAFHSYLHNLKPELQHAKIKWLTGRIRDTFELQPRSFRAGRYGANGTTIRILADLGYIVDSSVTPFQDHSRDGGPDFSTAPWRPYRVGGETILEPAEPGILWEIPVSVGYTTARFERAHAWRTRAENSGLRKLRAVGVLDRLGLARKIKFCPEQAGTRDLCRLANAFGTNDAPVMVMMLHSSSLIPGESPYARDEEQLERLLKTLEETLSYCVHSLGMTPATLTEAAEKLQQQDTSGRAYAAQTTI